MGAQAWAEPPTGDRIDVTDDNGQSLGWVDPLSGERTLLVTECRDVFDEVVDFWLAAAGLVPLSGAATTAAPAGPPPPGEPRGRVTEVRFPDAATVRTLVVPLLPAR